MPKDRWRTASRDFLNACRRGVRDEDPKENKVRRHKGRRKASGPKKRPSPDTAVYTIPAGTVCHVRKLGTRPWAEYTTRTKVEAWTYMWRNNSHHGFSCLGWEIKVKNHQFRGPKR